MENRINEIKYRVNKIIENKKISTLIKEENIIEQLDKIVQEVNNNNYEECNKKLKEIEEYLNEKEKNQAKKDDISFLTNLAKELREQQVRMSDISNPPLFVIKNELGEDIYFLTRKSLENYAECNLKNRNKIIDIPSNRSVELTELLNIIKRNF